MLFLWLLEAKSQAGGTRRLTPSWRRALSSFQRLFKRKVSSSYTHKCVWDPDR